MKIRTAGFLDSGTGEAREIPRLSRLPGVTILPASAETARAPTTPTTPITPLATPRRPA